MKRYLRFHLCRGTWGCDLQLARQIAAHFVVYSHSYLHVRRGLQSRFLEPRPPHPSLLPTLTPSSDVLPSMQTSAPPIETLSNYAPDTSYTWTVNLAASTAIMFRLTDATGSIYFSSPEEIQTGFTSCISSSATTTTVATPTSSANSSGTIIGKRRLGESAVTSVRMLMLRSVFRVIGLAQLAQSSVSNQPRSRVSHDLIASSSQPDSDVWKTHNVSNMNDWLQPPL